MSQLAAPAPPRYLTGLQAIRRWPQINYVWLYRRAALRRIDVELDRGTALRYSAADIERELANRLPPESRGA